MTRPTRRIVASVATLTLLVGCGAGQGGGGGAAGLPGQDGVADLVDAVKAGVVNIDMLGAGDAPMADSFAEGAPGEVVRGTGSGFFVRADGLIVTNQHVVAGEGRLRVTLSDGRRLDARTVGVDPVTDLAVVKVEGQGFPVLTLAEAKSLRVGQFVVAMGSPLGLEQSVTWGILSAVDRRLAYNARVTFLQTDAPINPGNSGGPLLNMKGEVVGVNAAVARRGQGIGFAVPVATLHAVLPQLEASGHVQHAWLGLTVAEAPDGGVVLGEVAPEGPADKAGLKQGDRLLAIDGQAVDRPMDTIARIAELPVGRTVTLHVTRAGHPLMLPVTLGDLPARTPRAMARYSAV